MRNLAYLVALHTIEGLGSVRLNLLLRHFKDPKLIWQASFKELAALKVPSPIINKLVELRKKVDPELEFDKLTKSDIEVTTTFDDNYPSNLSQIDDPPIVIYYRGQIKPADNLAIGIVGTRKMSSYGQVVTSQFASQLASQGVTIVSGLARGVDTQAHRSAITTPHGRTLAILGGGLNDIYPPENTGLAQQIADGHGAVLSIFPPSYPSLPGNFPARNKVIAGLSKAVLVTEAALDSGSLITARLAIDQGKEVFAIPGPINSSLSEGPLLLIKNGAKLVTDVAEILEELNLPEQTHQPLVNYDLTEFEQKIIDCLAETSRQIDEICRELNLPAQQISATLIKLEILGVVKSIGAGVYLKA